MKIECSKRRSCVLVVCCSSRFSLGFLCLCGLCHCLIWCSFKPGSCSHPQCSASVICFGRCTKRSLKMSDVCDGDGGLLYFTKKALFCLLMDQLCVHSRNSLRSPASKVGVVFAVFQQQQRRSREKQTQHVTYAPFVPFIQPFISLAGCYWSSFPSSTPMKNIDPNNNGEQGGLDPLTFIFKTLFRWLQNEHQILIHVIASAYGIGWAVNLHSKYFGVSCPMDSRILKQSRCNYQVIMARTSLQHGFKIH